MLTSVVIFGGMLFALWAHFKIRFRFADKIPCTQPMWPIFGNGLEFVNANSFQIFTSLTRAFKAHERIFRLSFGPVAVICPTHPDLIQKVLTDPASMEKPFFYNFLQVDKGLISSEYESWKIYRKLLNPAFNIRILNSFIPIFTDCASKMIQSMKEHLEPGKPLNVVEFTSACTLGMVCRTSLGSKALERDGTEKFIDEIECIFHNLGIRLFNWNLHLNWMYRFTGFYRAEKKARKYCYAFTDRIIDEKKEEFAKLKHETSQTDGLTELEDDMLSYKKPQIFIDQLLSTPLPNGNAFSYDEIRDHIYTLVAGGNETSATQTAHTALFLAMHPDIQQKVVAELRELLPSPDTEYTPEVLKQMVYLERVIKESMRLCPAAALFARKTLSSLQLDEHTIPKGTIIVLNIFDLHRRKDFWGENADRFDPDRFLPENSDNQHPFAFLPFSGGARNCIGSRYAMISLKIMISEMLRNFRLTTDIKFEDLKYEYKLTTQLIFEHRVFLEPRNLYC